MKSDQKPDVCVVGLGFLAINAGCEDGNALSAFFDESPEFPPSVESSYAGGRGALHGDEQLIIERVRAELRHGVEPFEKRFALTDSVGFGSEGIDAGRDLFSESAGFVVCHESDLLCVVCLLHRT